MQDSRKAKEFNVFNLLKLLTKHGMSLIVNLIMALLHGLQIETSACAETDLCFHQVNGSNALYLYISLANTVIFLILRPFTELFFLIFMFVCTIQYFIVTVIKK